MSNFFCGRADCRANTRLECSALVKKNPITGEGLDQLHCPFYMTKEKAEQIALDHLGLSQNQVTRLHTEYEIDDRIPQYEVQFHEGFWEYEFEIHAETGAILSFDKDD